MKLLAGPALLLAAAAALPLAAQAAYGPCLNNEALRHDQTVADPQLSPGGRRVVYVQRESTADGAASHLWLAPVSGATPPRQITFSPADARGGESSPAWLPDGGAILFLARRGQTRTILRLPLNGGEAAPLRIAIGAGPHALSLSVAAFAVSPDGRWIALRARQPLTRAEQAARKAKRDAVVVNEDPHQNRIWLYSFATGTTIALSPAQRQAGAFAWRPDSRALAYVSQTRQPGDALSASGRPFPETEARPQPDQREGGSGKRWPSHPPGNSDDLGPRHTVTLVDLGHPPVSRPVRGAPNTVSALAFSPDGRTLAMIAQSRHDAPPGVAALYLMTVAGGDPADLSDGDNAVMIAGCGLVWARDGRSLYLGGQRGSAAALLRYPVAAGPTAWLPAPGYPIAADFATNPTHSGWVFIAQSTNRLPQVAYAASPSAAATILSRANADWAQSGWVAAQRVSWPSPDGTLIHGLFYPARAPACPDAAPLRNGKSPLILSPHGGPTGAFMESFSPLVQWFTAHGWAVLEPNPRGSTGYGFAFVAANKNDLGDKDFQDEMAGVDWALAHEPVDPRRLGVYGYSYGGEMAGFIEGKTHRFAAIVAGAPVIDQYSEYGTESGAWYDRWFFGRPWLRPQDAWRQSPLAYAAQATTPMLLLQGQSDITDPLGQSEEEYRALRQDGVPVRLVTFPREVHGTLAGGIAGVPEIEPWHGFEARAQIKRWFDTYFARALSSPSGAPGRK
jgi:dipeptidyl aminopeptidase/acylaminoacyl peptidase